LGWGRVLYNISCDILRNMLTVHRSESEVLNTFLELVLFCGGMVGGEHILCLFLPKCRLLMDVHNRDAVQVFIFDILCRFFGSEDDPRRRLEYKYNVAHEFKVAHATNRPFRVEQSRRGALHQLPLRKRLFRSGFSRESANAIPQTQKLWRGVTHIWGNPRGQPARSAMGRPHPRATAFMITVSSRPGKYAAASFWVVV